MRNFETVFLRVVGIMLIVVAMAVIASAIGA